MQLDPRKATKNQIVPSGKGFGKTLALVELPGDVYFVVTGCHKFDVDGEPPDEEGEEYFYTEHTCPVNFIPVELICQNGDCDPHGVAGFIESVWMTTEYVEAVAAGRKTEYLKQLWPFHLAGR